MSEEKPTQIFITKINPITTQKDIEFTVTFKYKDSDEVIAPGTPIALKLSVTAADVIEDTTMDKVLELSKNGDNYLKTFEFRFYGLTQDSQVMSENLKFTNSTLAAIPEGGTSADAIPAHLYFSGFRGGTTYEYLKVDVY